MLSGETWSPGGALDVPANSVLLFDLHP